MKKILLILSIAFISCDKIKIKGMDYTPIFNYRIDYTDGIRPSCDFTYSYEIIQGGCIKYIDGRDEVIRCGSYSITKLK